MATSNVKAQCSICKNEEDTYECKGCLQVYCFNHLTGHRENINNEFNQTEDGYNSFRQILNDQKNDPEERLLIKQIDQWEKDSIMKIKQTAQECKQKLINYTNKHFIDIENKLNKLTDEFKETRKQNQFDEIYLNKIKKNLVDLKAKLDNPSNVSIKYEDSSFIKKIILRTIDQNTTWRQQGITVAGGNGPGNQLNQLSHPLGIFIDDDQTIYIADRENHRIVEWKRNAKNGQIVAGGNGKGNKTNQLDGPADVIIDKENNDLIISDCNNKRIMRWSRQNNTTNGEIIIENIECSYLTMDKNGSLYASDIAKDEVRRWKRGDKKGTIVAGGNGKGNSLNQLNKPIFIFVDEDYSLYVSEYNNHRVMKWLKDAKEGIVVAGGNNQGNGLTQLTCPHGVIVDQLGQIYVADSWNHRVMRWYKGAKEGTIVVGGNGQGNQLNQFSYSIGLSFDREGNLYAVDWLNHRIQKFEIN